MKKSGISLSYTANEKYQNSPRSWYLHYDRGLREIVTGSALPFGSAFDVAQGELLTNKNLEAAQDVFLKMWKSQQINGVYENLAKTDKVRWSKADYDAVILTEDDKKLIEKGNDKSWVSMRRKGVLMLEAYRDQVLPHLKNVVSTQEYVKIENGEGDIIRGYIDLIAEFELDKDLVMSYDKDTALRDSLLALEKYNGQKLLIDNKTTSVKYKEDSVKTSKQLATYLESPTLDQDVFYAAYFAVPKKFRTTKLPKIPIQIIIDEVLQETTDMIFNEYQDTLRGIKLGEFPCTKQCTKTPWGCCYEKYCDSEGKDLTGLVYVGKDKK